MQTNIRLLIAVSVVMVVSGCSTGIKGSPGLSLYEDGRYGEARPVLEQELADGRKDVAYALGIMYLKGDGVETDLEKAERLLLTAIMSGDPRGIAALSDFYETSPRCEEEKDLSSLWKSVGFLNRNLVSGKIEIHGVPPQTAIRLSNIYAAACGDVWDRTEVARAWLSVSKMPRRHTYVIFY